MINFSELVFNRAQQDTGVVLDNLDEVFDRLEEEEVGKALLATVSYIISKEQYRSFMGRPSEPQGDLQNLAFLFYKNRAIFVGIEKSGSSYLREIPFTREKLTDYVFTPTMYDLQNISLVNTEDVIARASVEQKEN